MQGTKEPNPVLQDEADNIEETIEMEETEEAFGAEQPGERHELILVAVSDSPNCPRVIRAAVRLAHQLDAPVKAVYVEQRRIEELGETERHHITESIQLLRSFGIRELPSCLSAFPASGFLFGTRTSAPRSGNGSPAWTSTSFPAPSQSPGRKTESSTRRSAPGPTRKNQPFSCFWRW